MREKHLVIFDGVCMLCDWWVRFIIRKDNRNQFLFFPFQKLDKKNLPENVLSSITESVVVYSKGSWYFKSLAIFELSKHLRFPWSLIRFFSILPTAWSDAFYNIISKKRNKIFGKYDSCPLVPKEFQEIFPDPDSFKDYLG